MDTKYTLWFWIKAGFGFSIGLMLFYGLVTLAISLAGVSLMGLLL